MDASAPTPRRIPPPLPSSTPFFTPPPSSAAHRSYSASASSASSSSPPSSSAPSSPSTSASLAPDVDLSQAYPVSPFDSVCLKHIRRYLQGYDRVYTRLLMDYGAERSKINQQHWERVHRLQQQHTQKLRRLLHEQSLSSSGSSSHSSRSSKHSEEEESKEVDAGAADAAADPSSDADEQSPAADEEKAAASSAPLSVVKGEAAKPRKGETEEAESAQLDSEYAEMKAELDSYHRACLSDANRRFRSMIIGLTHRLDHFLSTQISPSQLLQDLDVSLTVKAAGSQRTIEAKFSIRCIETFSDLRRRFVHFMREERGDAVLAFTPDSQFLILNATVNPACKTDVSHAYVRQPPAPPSKRQQEEQREEERKAAHVDVAPHSMYSLTRPLAAFRARATRARAGYATKVSTKVSSVEEESSVNTTPVGDGGGTGRRGSTDLSGASGAATTQTSSWPPSPSSDQQQRASTFTASQDIQPLPMPSFSTSDALPSSSHSSSPSVPPSSSISSSTSLAPPPLLILDEDVAVMNFVADFVPRLTVHLMGAVVLVSDQAANLPTRRPLQPLHPPPHRAQAKDEGVGPATRPRSLHALGATASRLPAKLLPHLRQHLAHAPPLPKLPPALAAFFTRTTQPHSLSDSHPHPNYSHNHGHSLASQAPTPAPPAFTAPSDPSLHTALETEGKETPTAVISPPSGPMSELTASGSDPASDAALSPPQASQSHSVSSAASDSSGGSDDDDSDSVQHVSISYSSYRESHGLNPIDDDDLDESMLTNAASLRPPYPSRRAPLRTRNLSHPLASHPSSASASSSASTSVSSSQQQLPPLPLRYPHLSVSVDGDVHDRIDSVIPSQSFSVDIPFIDYDQDSLLDAAEDSRAMESSVARSERSEMDRETELSIIRGGEGEGEDEGERERLEEEEEEGEGDPHRTSQQPRPVGEAISERRARREPFDSASNSIDADNNGLLMQHSHSFSHSSSSHSSCTPPSALPTPSMSRPPSATSELLAAGILHLPRHQSTDLRTSLRSSSTGGGHSPFPVPVSPPMGVLSSSSSSSSSASSSVLLSPLMRSPSPADAGQRFIGQLQQQQQQQQVRGRGGAGAGAMRRSS